MFGIGTTELMVILGLALILLGPKKIPEIARSLGRTMAELRKTADELKESIAEEIEPLKEDMPKREEIEGLIKKELEGEEKEDGGGGKTDLS